MRICVAYCEAHMDPSPRKLPHVSFGLENYVSFSIDTPQQPPGVSLIRQLASYVAALALEREKNITNIIQAVLSLGSRLCVREEAQS